MRAGQGTEAVTQVRQLVKHTGKPAMIARLLANMPLTAPLVTDPALRIPEFAHIPLGIHGELQGIVEQYLNADGVKFFLGELPPEKQQNARDAFLQLQTGELQLFFYDWTFWQNATNGFVITSQRVLWKCLWEAPVVTYLRLVDLQCLRAEKSLLHVNSHNIDLEDENLAGTMSQVLREICVTVNKA